MSDGWKFAKELSNALLKVRPLGGSELFVKRNGDHYADPAYCARMIEDGHTKFHETMKRAILAEREVERLRTENWQLKQACGYPIPADKETPQNPFKCGICDARSLSPSERANSHE